MAMKLKESKTPRWTCAATVICGLAGVVAWSLPVSSRAQEAHVTQAMEITLDPDSPGALRTPTVGLTHQERESLLARKRQLERDAAAATRNDPPSPAGLPAVEGQGTDPVAEDDSRFPFAPGSLIIVRNNLNPPTTSQSTLAEPAAANNAANVLATGNFSHYEFSLNGGVTWTKTVFPAGPAAAPFSCCDNDVIHDRGRGVTFMSALYTNAALREWLEQVEKSRHQPSGEPVTTPGPPHYRGAGGGNAGLGQTRSDCQRQQWQRQQRRLPQ